MIRRLISLLNGPFRRREARELREIADLGEGLLKPEVVQQLRELADKKDP